MLAVEETMSRGPDLARREVWRRRFREFERGKPRSLSCPHIGVSIASFYQWRRVGGGSAERAARAAEAQLASPQVTLSPIQASAMSFLPVEIMGQARSTVEVLRPNGARVLVPSDERKAIRAVVEAVAGVHLEAKSC